ncbi:MAG TPA: hypothetical protein VKM93_20225, partial [Terriglobia bacterium]|nr:hypothetical protein [Terriglobia bacterium]
MASDEWQVTSVLSRVIVDNPHPALRATLSQREREFLFEIPALSLWERVWSFYILSRSSSDELGGTRLNAELFQQFGMLGSFLAEEGDQIETRGTL